MPNDVTVSVQDNNVTVMVQEQDLFVASTGLQNSSYVNSISDILDVDTTSKEDGSVLVYEVSTNKWTSTRLLNKQYMEGGEF